MFDKIIAHASFIGETGYASHSRNFFIALNKAIPVKVRNFAVGITWKEFSNHPHDDEIYVTDICKEMLIKQTLFDERGKGRKDYFIYGGDENDLRGNIFNIILMETDHYYYYDNYRGPKIAYNVWESTLYPEHFFNKLLEFDQLWVPSKWQRDCAIAQGMESSKVKVVPEGVEGNIFYPEIIQDSNILKEYSDGRFKFILFGRWDYRKSINEIIGTFLKTFSKDERVDLIISVDNQFSTDGMKSTEERLSHYGFEDDRIKIKHFPTREEYIKYLKTGHIFVSCARSEGWNLPLIEAMACGTPSIYSNWGAQLEFAEGKGLPVNIKGESLAKRARFLDNVPGNYCDPDFEHLSTVMRDAYINYNSHKNKAIKDSEIIRENFSWGKAAEKALDIIKKYELDNYIKVYEYTDYDSYKRYQIEENHKKINWLYADKNSLVMLSKYIKKNIPDVKFGICHGVRRGVEQSIFKEEIGIEVIGTEISDTANQFLDTIQWDFHNIKDEWINAVDFIYSNSFDHAYNPIQCLDSWMKCIKPGGICIIEWSYENEGMPTKEDPFAAEIEHLINMISEKYNVKEVLTNDGIKDIGETYQGDRQFIIIENKNNREEIYGHGNWWETIKREVYDENMYEKYFPIEKGDVVVDIGAHAGFFSLTCVGKDIERCYSLEPYSINFEDLQRNIKLAGEERKFILINKAIDFESGTSNYNLSIDMGVVGKSVDSKGEDICTISFLDFIEKHQIEHIDFLKIDCEGGEYSIINDEKNWDFLKNKVDKIAGEIHMIDTCPDESVKLINNLSKLGFDVILNSTDGVDITNYFYNHIDYYKQIQIYAKKNKSNNIAFITGGDKGYMPFVKMCAQNLSKFSDIPVVTYGYNCDVDFDYSGIIKKRIDFNQVKQVEGHIDTTYYFAKIQSCIDAIDSGEHDYYVWIDSDTIPCASIFKVFDYIKDVENYPLCMRYNDETLIHWKKIEDEYYESMYGDEVCSLYNITPRTNGWLAAMGLFIFDKNSKWFFEEILRTGEEVRDLDVSRIKKDKLGNNLFIDDNAFSEERIANMLFWKNKFNNYLPVTWVSRSWKSNKDINLDDIMITTDTVQRFVDEDYDIMFTFPKSDRKTFHLLPINEDNILFFHAKPKQKDMILTKELNKSDEIKLNLGCGDDVKSGYINIDLYSQNADIQMDIKKLDYTNNSVSEIYSSHALEHFPRREIIPILLEWNRVLKRGGKLIMNLPDLEWCMLNWLNTPEINKWDFSIDSIFGNQLSEGEFHKTGFTKARLEYLLDKTGYGDISIVDQNSHWQVCFLVEAKKV